MKTCLIIGIITSVIGACGCIGIGLSLMLRYSGGAGAILILLGTPTSFALAIVFHYVCERLDDDKSKYVNDRLSETTGTPWENHQDHTTKK